MKNYVIIAIIIILIIIGVVWFKSQTPVSTDNEVIDTPIDETTDFGFEEVTGFEENTGEVLEGEVVNEETAVPEITE